MLTIKQKILSLAGVSLIGFGSVSYIIDDSLSSNTSNVNAIQNVMYPAINSASMNKININYMAEKFALSVTLGDVDIIKENDAILIQMNNFFDEQKKLVPEYSSEITSLKTQTNQYFDVSKNIAFGIINGDVDFSKLGDMAKQNQDNLGALVKDLNSFYSTQETTFKNTVSEMEENNKKSEIFILSLSFFTLLFILVISVLIVKGIKKDIASISNKLQDIAEGEGDLTTRLAYTKKDELEPLVNAFNQFVEKLLASITHTVNNTNNLNVTTEKLLSSSARTGELSIRQNASIEEVGTAMEQLSLAIGEIAQNANDAATAAKSANDEAINGNEQVQNTISSVEKLTVGVRNAKEIINELDSSAQNASSILKAINEIAEQTNLLALNAAIEAARAGEQGRGFAVVADEVRKLAQRTQDSTQEIQIVLNELQQKSSLASNIIEENSIVATECQEQSLIAEQSLTKITIDVEQINQRNEMIAAATDEQEQTTAHLQSYIQDIRKMAEGSAEEIQELDSIAQEISEATNNISEVTSKFKIN